MELNQMIDISRQFAPTGQQASLAQDNQNKTQFALNMLARMPQQEPAKVEPPKIPSLGAMAIPS